MNNLDDTQPNRIIRSRGDEIPAPPRWLLWAVILLFLLGIAGAFAGVYIFREVLRPSQQQRVIDNFGFMRAFLPRGEALPTAGAIDEEALENLLLGPLGVPTPTPQAPASATAENTPEPTPETTDEPEATEESALVVAVAATAAEAGPLPSATISQAAPPGPEPTPLPQASMGSSRPVVHINYGFRWERQDWNNCGPTNVTMALSYYGWTRDQQYAASFIRPEREDKNVSPHELVDFVNTYTDLEAIWRMGGDLDILRSLVANGFPVIIETGYMPEGYEWIGHYQTIVGYDDTQQHFFVYDSFLGDGRSADGITESYSSVDNNWQNFNRVFVAIYEPAREPLLMQLLNTRADLQTSAEHALNVARSEARANPQNGFAFFNMGTSLVQLGRFEEAALAFDRATQLNIPRRMLWYQFGPFEAYYRVGRYEDVLIYVENNLVNGAQYVEETYYWQGLVFAAQGRTQDAINAFRTALRRNQNFAAARDALNRLTS